MAKIGNVWVFIEQEQGKIAGVSLQLVSKGRELADRLGVKLEGILLGNNLSGCVDTLYHYGCDRVILAEDPRLEPFTVLPFAKVIMQLIREHNPNILLFGATLKGRELAPRIASEKRAGLTADCTKLEIDPEEDHFEQVRSVVKILNYVQDADVDDEIPPTSLVREFIGGNSFYRVS